MSLKNAKNHLQKYGLEKNIMEFSTSSARVAEAAETIGCKEEEIAKTLAFFVEEQPVVIVVAGDKKIDNAKYKNTFHTKAKMVPFEEVKTIIGHEVGGVCPFGVCEGVIVYLDESLKEHPIVYPACGTHASAVKLTLKELEKASEYKEWVDVCKTIEKAKQA